MADPNTPQDMSMPSTSHLKYNPNASQVLHNSNVPHSIEFSSSIPPTPLLSQIDDSISFQTTQFAPLDQQYYNIPSATPYISLLPQRVTPVTSTKCKGLARISKPSVPSSIPLMSKQIFKAKLNAKKLVPLYRQSFTDYLIKGPLKLRLEMGKIHIFPKTNACLKILNSDFNVIKSTKVEKLEATLGPIPKSLLYNRLGPEILDRKLDSKSVEIWIENEFPIVPANTQDSERCKNDILVREHNILTGLFNHQMNLGPREINEKELASATISAQIQNVDSTVESSSEMDRPLYTEPGQQANSTGSIYSQINLPHGNINDSLSELHAQAIDYKSTCREVDEPPCVVQEPSNSSGSFHSRIKTTSGEIIDEKSASGTLSESQDDKIEEKNYIYIEETGAILDLNTLTCIPQGSPSRFLHSQRESMSD